MMQALASLGVVKGERVIQKVGVPAMKRVMVLDSVILMIRLQIDLVAVLPVKRSTPLVVTIGLVDTDH